MTFDELFKKLEEDDASVPTDAEIDKMAKQLVVDSAVKETEPNSTMINKISQIVTQSVIAELKKSGLVKTAGDQPASQPGNEATPNTTELNPADKPPASASPNTAPQAELAKAMAAPSAPAVAAAAGVAASPTSQAADITIGDAEKPDQHAQELQLIADTAEAMLNEGVTDDPTAALAAAALATIQESMATGETEAEAGAEAAEGQAEALNSLAEKVSSIIASDYGMKMGRDVVKDYLMKNLIS